MAKLLFSLPNELLTKVDLFAKLTGSHRSEYIRQSLREKMERDNEALKAFADASLK